jgi:hypothetical protein
MSKLTLELTLDEVNVVLAGLGELPAKASIGVIEKVRMQVIPQVQQQPPAMPNVSVEEVPSA